MKVHQCLGLHQYSDWVASMDEDLSLNLSTHATKPSMVANACNLLGRQRQEVSWSCRPVSPYKMVRPRFWDCLKKTMQKNWRDRPMVKSLQLLVTSVPVGLIPFCSLCGHCTYVVQITTCRHLHHTHKNQSLKVIMWGVTKEGTWV